MYSRSDSVTSSLGKEEVAPSLRPCDPRDKGGLCAHRLTNMAAPGDGATDLTRTRGEVPKSHTSIAFSVTELDFVQF